MRPRVSPLHPLTSLAFGVSVPPCAGGESGAVEASGVVQPGDRVVGVGGLSTAGLSYAETAELIDVATRQNDDNGRPAALCLRFAPAPPLRSQVEDGGAAVVMETRGRAKQSKQTRGVF